jgi:hypothetical protein
LVDTRSGIGAPTAPVAANRELVVDVTGIGGVPTTGVEAVVVNLTATAPTRPGYLTAFPDGQSRPTASNLNFQPGATVPNLVTVKVGTSGNVRVFNGSTGPTHVIVDVAGWYGAGGSSAAQFRGVSPYRLFDTRVSGSPLGQGQTVSKPVLAPGGWPEHISAVVLNVTAVSPTAAGYVTVFPTGAAVPTASNLNFVAGQTVPNQVIVKTTERYTSSLGYGDWFSAYNNSGKTHLIVDVVGYFE